MPAKIIPLPRRKKTVKQLIEDVLEQDQAELDEPVLECLKEDLEILLNRHFRDEPPEFTLRLPADLTEDQFQVIRQNFKKIFMEHNELMMQRSKAIFHDLYLSRLEICELKHGQRSPD